MTASPCMRPCPPSPLRALRTSPRLACTLPASPSVGFLWDRPENPRQLAYGQTRTTFFVVAPGTPSAALPALTHAFPRTSARAQSPPSPHACRSACAHASTRPRQRSSLLHASLSLPVACPRPAPRALCTPREHASWWLGQLFTGFGRASVPPGPTGKSPKLNNHQARASLR